MGGGSSSRAKPIAIVGASCRFPGAPDLARFWDLLQCGGDAIGEIPDDRWTKSFFFHPHAPTLGKSYTWAAGTLGDISGFDAGFFGISPREAEQVDPQQRLLLELAWEALEDAGLVPSRLAGKMAGVYIGASSMDYAFGNSGDPAVGNAYFMTGTSLSILANRVSYLFDLKGPSLVVDTACSSSLVALDLACRALNAGEVELALVGGVNLLLSPYPYLGFCQAQMLSRQGRCFAFDARADGYVRAEGGGIVVLKPLDAALAAGDAIRGVVLGTGVNQDGRTVGLSMPNGAAQAELLRGLYDAHGIAPEALSFVEAHGTGTPVGDPIEAAALGEALGRRRAAKLAIGSVKSNLGHLEPASGMAGLIKTLLALEHRQLPRTLHCETLNPRIDFDALNLRVAAEPLDLTGGALVAGVNSFGFGGTNAHAILGSAPPLTAASGHHSSIPPLLLSARSEAALADMARDWAELLAGEESAHAKFLSRGLARHREQHRYRRVLDGNAVLAEGTALARGKDKLVFVFSGNGAQWPGMARDALAASPNFRAAAETVGAALTPLLGWSPLTRLLAEPPAPVDRTDVSQPLLFLIQVAAVEALKANGVTPEFCVGHSVGEIAAAWAAGALSLTDAARIVVERSHQQERTRGAGRLAALGMSEAEAAPLLARIGGLEIAAINSVNAITVAGPLAALQRLERRAKAAEKYFQLLDLDYPFHSAAMETIRADLIASLGGIAPRDCGGRFVSTVTGAPLRGAELGADYWWRNIREPVRFAAAIDHLIADHAGIFVEIGPNPILLSYLRAQLRHAETEGRVIATLTRQPDTRDPFPRLAAECFAAGYDLARAPIFDGAAAVRGLPLYPWQRTRHWFAPTAERIPVARPAADHPLLGVRRWHEQWSWTSLLDTEARPWLADHAVERQPVLAAACFVEIAAGAARAKFGDAPVLEIANLDLFRALPLGAEPRELRTDLGGDGGITMASRARLSDEPWLHHAGGRVAAPGAAPPSAWPDFAPRHTISAEALYRIAGRLGLDYGASFRAVASVEIAEREARVIFAGGEGPEPECLIDPTRLDGALQGFLALLAERGGELAGQSLLPVRFGRVRLHAPFGRAAATARLRLDHVGRRAASGALALCDQTGAVIAEIEDCWFRQVQLRRPLDPAEDGFHLALAATRAPNQAPAIVALDACVAAANAASGDGADSETALLLDAYLEAARNPAELPPAAEIWRTILAESPEHGAELALAAGAMADAEPPADLVEQMLYGSPTGRRAMAALEAAVMSFAARWPADRPLRIVEIGARSGALARRLLRAVARRALTVTYLATDPDPDRRARLDAAIGEWPDARAATWRPGSDESPPFDPSGFDLAVSLYGLTRCGRDAVGKLNGAGLLAVEPLPNPLWQSVFADSACRAAAEWRALLRGAGFIEIQSGDAIAGVWPAQLIAAAAAPREEREAAPSPERVAIIIAPTGDGIAQRLARKLDAAGVATRLIDPPAAADGAELLGALSEAKVAEPEIIVLPASATSFDDTTDRLTGILTVTRLVTGARDKARLMLVTRDAQQPRPAAIGPAAAGAASWAMGRVVANEMPQLQCRLVDFPSALAADALVERLAGEILSPDAEREIVWTPSGRNALRLRRGLPVAAAAPAQHRLAAARPGLLDSLAFVAERETAPGPGEIALRVEAAGVNFRDVMWALDLLPEEALKDGFAGPGLGLECAGVVTAIGPKVEGFAIGDRVAGFAPHALASHVVTRAEAVARLPDGMEFATAASLPVIYLTASYALGTLARLERGETVLIHGGAGGVGIAAIHYARHRGAHIIATAGNETKRAFLRMLGVDHVFDSRSLAFADDVMRVTGGAGVDVVLNSLGGDAMERSLGLLKPFGRFLELGKRDFYLDTRIGLRPLRQNISYFAVDADQLSAKRPELARKLLTEIMALVQSGALLPPPRRIFGFADAAEAFRLMQGAGHIGKIVLCSHLATNVVAEPARDFIVRPDRTYLVTGGLSGFGLATARWLAKHGARHLALIGRRGAATPGAAEVLVQFSAAGVDARAYAGDIADADMAAGAVATIRAAQPPLAGVVHAAMVLDDALLGDLNADRIAAVLAPKLAGAENLDRLTRGDALDWFLLYSSATTLMGAPGQGNYVAANGALEGLARRRNAQGLPSLAVAWGPIADVGFLAARHDKREALSRRLAAMPMAADEALDRLPALWAGGTDMVALARVNWRGARRLMPILDSPTFADFAAAMADSGGGDLRERLTGLLPDEAKEMVAALLQEEIGRVLMLAPDKIDRTRPLAALGMDSLMAVELRLALESRLAIDLPLLSLSEGTNIAALANLVVRTLGGERNEAALATTAGRHESDADVMREAQAADRATARAE